MQGVESSVLQPMLHQYVTRADQRVVTEQLFGDWIVNLLYGRAREQAGTLLRLVTSGRVSRLLALVNFDLPFAARLVGQARFLRGLGVDLGECVEPLEFFDSSNVFTSRSMGRRRRLPTPRGWKASRSCRFR